MGRWPPDTPARLMAAAIDLFEEHGYEGVTVAEIAVRAGLTERTFFRHFADKREVLFSGSGELVRQLAHDVRAAPAELTGLAAIAAALRALSPFFDARREWSLRRRTVVRGSPELTERELIKRVALADALVEALRVRGVAPAPARVQAEAGVAAFHLAYDRWAEDPARRGYAAHVEEVLAELRAAVAA